MPATGALETFGSLDRDAGGAMFNPVLVSCDMTGSYITHDGGQSWRMFGVVGFFVFDPMNPKIIYTQATGLWRSADGGESWNLVYPKPSTIKDVVMKSDHADEVLVRRAQSARHRCGACRGSLRLRCALFCVWR